MPVQWTDTVWILYREKNPGTIHSSTCFVSVHASKEGAEKAADLLRADVGFAGHGVWVEEAEVQP